MSYIKRQQVVSAEKFDAKEDPEECRGGQEKQDSGLMCNYE